MKIKVGVIFGGETVEHEVSIITAIQAMEHIREDKYEIVPIYITKDRIWNLYRKQEHLNVFKSAWCFVGWAFRAVKRRV